MNFIQLGKDAAWSWFAPLAFLFLAESEPASELRIKARQVCDIGLYSSTYVLVERFLGSSVGASRKV